MRTMNQLNSFFYKCLQFSEVYVIYNYGVDRNVPALRKAYQRHCSLQRGQLILETTMAPPYSRPRLITKHIWAAVY